MFGARLPLLALLCLVTTGACLAQPADSGFAVPLARQTIVEPEVTLATASSGAKAPWEEYSRFLHSRREVTALAPDVFGDSVDLYTGTLSFTVTDLSVPGNASLPVEVRRSFTVAGRSGGAIADFPFADRELDVPRIEGIYGATWPADRCSNAAGAPNILVGSTLYTPADYWQGLQAKIPAGGELLVANQLTPKPSVAGASYKWVTPNLAYLACLGSVRNGAGEGFLAVTPDGTRYWFDHLAQFSESALLHPMNSGAGNSPLLRRRHVLYATRVEDRFGNYVLYNYSNAAQQPARLTSIEANDGRLITLSYNPAGRISGISSHGRTWTYTYNALGTSLTAVALPGGNGQWTLDLAALSAAEIEYSSGDPRDCTTPGRLLTNDPVFGSVSTPSGARGTFTVTARRAGRSNVPKACVNWTTPNLNPNDDVAYFVRDYHILSLATKTVEGPGLSPMSWHYSYLGAYSWACENNTATCPTTASGAAVCIDDACAGSTRTTIAGPNGDWRRYTFGNSYRYNEGLLTRFERGASASEILQTETLAYEHAQSGMPYSSLIGESLRKRGDGHVSERRRPQKLRQILRDGDLFSWHADAFDAYARPIAVRRTSNLSLGGLAVQTRNEALGYHDHTAIWVIGQPASLVVNGVVAETTSYEASHALPQTRWMFGKRQQTLGYDTTSSVASGQRGTLRTVQDGNDKTTTLSSWKRGFPQRIDWRDAASQAADVNDRGEITRVVDENGFATCYAYDAMGRISEITYPSELTTSCDQATWSPTTIHYAAIDTSEYGIPAGHWRRTETTGSRVHQTYYDALLRPILTRQSASDGSATERFIRRAFDHEGREIFSAYPLAALSTYLNAIAGRRTSYDALGRVIGTAEDYEDGVLTTTTRYSSPLTIRHTDARDQLTTTTFHAYDEPRYDTPLRIAGPEGLLTTYTRDTFGKPLTLTRQGDWLNPLSNVFESTELQRRYVYDDQQQLCMTIEPDAGVTVVDHDGAGNLSWRATGQNHLAASTSCQRTSVALAQRSLHVYDARNRLLAIDHPAGTQDIGYTYLADGALHTASTGILSSATPPLWASKSSEWTYAYNRRRLLTGETLAIDGRSFALARGYNERADLQQLTYPGGQAVALQPNAYGEPRQAGNYASAASYHPNGMLAGFSYGNGSQRSVTLNARQMPERLRDQRGGEVQFDHQLSYDAVGNLERLVDGAPGGLETRTLGYDGQNRLVSVSAASGSESYLYDPLDRIRRVVQNGVVRHYTYEAASHRLSQVTTQGSSARTDYAWNPRGELTSRRRAQTIAAATPASGLFGNGFEQPATSAITLGFSFDAGGRMVATSDGLSYRYDAHGRRVSTVVPQFGTRYQVYDRGGALRYVEDSSRNERTEFIHLGNTLVAERTRPLASETAIIGYLHSDHRGTPTLKTASNGQQVYRSRLKAYGDPYDGIWREGPGFTKHAMDEASELVYMQQRYYDPEMLGFLSPDPVAADGGNFNRYWYANNNPYTFVDPDGRAAVCLIPGPMQACAAVATAVVSTVAKGVAIGAAAGTALIGSIKLFNEATTESQGDDQAPSPTQTETKERQTAGGDGGRSTISIERDENGEAISRKHTVTTDGEVVHQHQEQLGKYGGERAFPDSWTGTDTVNAEPKQRDPEINRIDESR